MVIGLPASALAAYCKQQDRFRAEFGPDYRNDLEVIFAEPDGTPLKPNSISATVSALFRRVKIPKPKGAALHLLRHSHGSHMLANGVPLPVVSQRLGHSSVRTTADIYAHAIHGQDDEAVQKWENYQVRNRPTKTESCGATESNCSLFDPRPVCEVRFTNRGGADALVCAGLPGPALPRHSRGRPTSAQDRGARPTMRLLRQDTSAGRSAQARPAVPESPPRPCVDRSRRN